MTIPRTRTTRTFENNPKVGLKPNQAKVGFKPEKGSTKSTPDGAAHLDAMVSVRYLAERSFISLLTVIFVGGFSERRRDCALLELSRRWKFVPGRA